MARSRDLGSNAPITEALIDIFVSLPKGASLDQLRSLHGGIKDEYPELETRRRWQGKFQFADGSMQSQTQSVDADGFLFRSPDRLDIVQFRMDGFTANRLAPYQGFEALTDRALTYFGKYSEGISPEAVLAVGVRYINNFTVPFGEDLKVYFRVAPELPEGFDRLADFTHSAKFSDPMSGAVAEVVLARNAAAPPNATGVGCILELGAQRQINRRLERDELSGVLAELRGLKNRIFFGCVTDECLDALGGGV